MVYPGLPGQVGPPPASNIGQQVRQSQAGSYPGNHPHKTVIDAMGSNAPSLAVTAARLTVEQEVTADPHPIEAQNFELDFDQEGVGTADFGSPADYTGQGGS